MTNLEFIKTLSVEEMQEFLAGKTDCNLCFYNYKQCWKDKTMKCKGGMIKWLESEHKEYEDDEEDEEDE